MTEVTTILNRITATGGAKHNVRSIKVRFLGADSKVTLTKTQERRNMKLYELVIVRNGKEEVIKRNLTEEDAIRYFNGIDNTYYMEQKGE